jgi:hypothetical protein
MTREVIVAVGTAFLGAADESFHGGPLQHGCLVKGHVVKGRALRVVQLAPKIAEIHVGTPGKVGEALLLVDGLLREHSVALLAEDGNVILRQRYLVSLLYLRLTSRTSRCTPGLGPSAYRCVYECAKRGMLKLRRSRSPMLTKLAMLSFWSTVKPGQSIMASVKRRRSWGVNRSMPGRRDRNCLSVQRAGSSSSSSVSMRLLHASKM